MEFPTEEDIIGCLKTVVDPEFPLVDIHTMGLIYDIKIKANAEEANELIGEKAKMDNVDKMRSLDSANIDDSMAPLGIADPNEENIGERDDE
jgi:hypothetical protein